MEEKLLKEIERLVNMLATLDPTDDSYVRTISNIQNLEWLLSQSFNYAPPAKPLSAEEELIARDEPAVEETPIINEPKEPEVKEDYLYTKEMVRDILTNAAESGVKIKPILAKYIPEGQAAKLSSVPAAAYAQLVEEVENAR